MFGAIVKEGGLAAHEIAAYHFDAALGTCRVPPTVGYDKFGPRSGVLGPARFIEPYIVLVIQIYALQVEYC